MSGGFFASSGSSSGAPLTGSKVLTKNVYTPLFKVTVPGNTLAGGGGFVTFTAKKNDGSKLAVASVAFSYSSTGANNGDGDVKAASASATAPELARSEIGTNISCSVDDYDYNGNDFEVQMKVNSADDFDEITANWSVWANVGPTPTNV